MNNIILNADQEKVVNAALKFLRDDSRQILEFTGNAGCGKSVILHEIIRRAHLKSNEYEALAYTGAAACVMRTKGFQHARSIHSLLYELIKVPMRKYNDDGSLNLEYDTALNKPKYEYKFVPREAGTLNPEIKLFIIDEGYMVPDYMKKDILKHGVKVIVAGDANQLPPIGGDPAFLTGEGVMRLTQIMRQQENNPIVYLANRVLNNEPIHCGCYGNKVLVIPDTELTTDMVMDVGNIICGTNKTRDYFNTKIRGILGLDPRIPTYGDRVICRNNNWQIVKENIALANGLAGVISSPVSINSYNISSNSVNIDFLPDLLSTPFNNLSINYNYLCADYETRNKMKDNKFAMSDNGELFEYAYALTTHLAQGSEYPCGIFYEEYLRSNIQKQLCYTGITRFREYMIYVKKTNKYY